MHQTLTITHSQEFSPSLSNKALVSVLAVLVLAMVFNVAITLRPVQAIDYPNQEEQLLIDLTNKERQAQGLSVLQHNDRLAQAARAKAYHMLKHGYFEHFTPTGKTPWEFIENAGYNYHKAGENLAIDFPSNEAIVPAWMVSPTHKANIVKPDYQEIGMAVVKGEFQGRQTTIIVQMFGTPANPTRSLANTIFSTITSPLSL